mmetsp:Transcript_60815/g.143660  ORF Transcript_60815/g.143660 Transcript_60815/m.143660 type:complete len:132 (+) Transcript_60815:719-1114(+)
MACTPSAAVKLSAYRDGGRDPESLWPVGERPFPNLQYLGLRNADIVDELCVPLVDSQVMQQLRHVDLSEGCLSNVGARELLRLCRNPPPALQRLSLSHNWVGADLRAQLSAGLSGVVVDWGEIVRLRAQQH